MFMTPSSSAEQGFTLLELVIALAVVAILSVVAVPSFVTWVQNAKTRSTAEALQNGIRLAKTEAVRRNRLVDFRLTAVAPALDAATSVNGEYWYVQQKNGVLPSETANVFIQGSSLSGANVNIDVTGDVDTLTFNGLGRLTGTASSYKFDIKNPRGDRDLRVIVTQSGQIRMCDPKITLSVTTPTGCP